MRLNVTPIGSARLSAAKVARAVVEYLAGVERKQPAPSMTPPGKDAAEDRGIEPAAGYYADSVEGPGQWLGTGASWLGLEGLAEREAFARVLEGRHPTTGERLLRATGVADRSHLAVGRATRRDSDGAWLYDLADTAKALGLPRSEVGDLILEGDDHSLAEDRHDMPWLRASVDDQGERWISDEEIDRFAARSAGMDRAGVLATGDPFEVLSIQQASRLLGVSPQYLRESARYWEQHRQEIEALEGAGLRPRRAWVVATRERTRAGHPFRITREEVAAFAERRQRPVVRVGYDVTLSTEKSVAVLALLSRPDRQRAVLAAIDEANDAALRFLEERASVGRRLGRSVGTEGLVVASFLHATSRALDPFPHRHNVVANAVVDEHGERRALDGRALYRHAPAAAALATATLRWRLSTELGVHWRRSPRGVWEAEGIPDETLREFSTRRDEVDAALAELAETLGRPIGPADTDQVVLATRAAKARTPVEQLRAGWMERAAATGLGRRELEACFGRSPAHCFARLPDAMEHVLGDWLDGEAVTESATFARGEVIAAITRWTTADGHLIVLPPEEVLRLADRFLASERVIELVGRARRARDSITRGDGVRVDATGGESAFTTVSHLRLEQEVIDVFERGTTAERGVVSADVTLAEDGWHELSSEQQRFVEALCVSGMSVQCGIGRPGSGKTHSLAVAARTWERAGYRVVGGAVKGEAARLLSDATGVRAETVAWWLKALDTGHQRLDDHTVILVDEASTLSTIDLARLLDHAEQAGAVVRLVGDPAQHGSVAAGGMFAALCRRTPRAVPVLSENRRQTSEVDRQVVDAVRGGRVGEALAALRAAGQLTEVRNADELYGAMVLRWLSARAAGEPHPMIDRRNHTRQILNAVAHRVLQSEGQVAVGGFVTTDGREFCVGDEIVARRPARRLHPPDSPREYVRNGSRGRIVGFRAEEPTGPRLVVDFESLGRIEVPGSFVEAHADRRGRVAPGLDYGYALTSYAVQGATLPASTSAVTAGARRRELYVNLTRGRHDNHLFVAAPADSLAGEGHLPRPPENDVIAEVLAAVGRPDEDRCALEIDPDALRVAAARAGRGVADLRRQRASGGMERGQRADDVLARAETVAAAAAARSAIAEPPPWVSAMLPPRPTVPWMTARWDTAVGAVATYRARWEPDPVGREDPMLRVLGSPGCEAEREERFAVRTAIGGVWAAVAARDLAGHVRQSEVTDRELRTVLDSPPTWMLRHLAELGSAGRFAEGVPVRTLVALYADVIAFRSTLPEQREPIAVSGPALLLGEPPTEPLSRRQWDVLAVRAQELGARERSRARA